MIMMEETELEKLQEEIKRLKHENACIRNDWVQANEKVNKAQRSHQSEIGEVYTHVHRYRAAYELLLNSVLDRAKSEG